MATVPTGINYIWLPLSDGEGASLSDSGNTGATFTVVDGGSNAWGTGGWFSGSNASNNYLWTDDSTVIDMFDMFGTNGTGGKCLFITFEFQGTATSGTLLTYGSTTGSSGGFQILYSSTNLFININPDGASTGSNRKLVATAAWPTTGSHHVAFMFDFKHGDYKCILDGDHTFPPTTDFDGLMGDADDLTPGDGTVGITLMSRNTDTTGGSRTPQSSYDGKLRKFFAADLSSVENPWRSFRRDATAFKNAPANKLPKVVESWL